jgi:anaerobic magnesium-protoporphyrin IX monomethyl ester cyclase
LLDAVLIYPPIANPFYPYLSTPTLASYLQANGRTVEQRDINLELFDTMFTTDYLDALENDFLEKINANENLPEMNWRQQEEQAQLICLKIGLENLRNSTDLTPEAVKTLFRDKNSYKYDDNLPFLLEPWTYYQKLNTILTYLITPVPLPVADTKSVQRAIRGEEYYPYYKLLKEKFVPDILKDKPKFVGISITYQTQVVQSLYLGYLLKQADPSIHLSIGGQHLSTISHDIPDFYKDIDFIDSIVVDEGELAITHILDYIDGKEEIENIPNTFYIKDGQVVENRKDVIKDINDSPLPDFSGLPLDKYFTGSLVLPYAASKGCYYNKCTFCSFPFISPKYRVKTPEDVAVDLKLLSEKYDTKLFYLTNEADPPKRIKQLSEEIIKQDMGIYYHSFCRFDRKVDREMVQLLADSGCKVLFFGLESGSNRINEMMMNKGINLDRARTILKDCDELKISTVVSSIIAFATETLEESMQTKIFLEESSFYKNHVPQSHDFRLPRGTDTEINHQKYGVTRLYRNEGNLATILSNYATNYKIMTQEERKQARIQHETVGLWPHHDCLELQYALYYDGDIPTVFSYNKKLEKPENPKQKVKKPYKQGYSYERNCFGFDELIKRKEFRYDLMHSLYKKGYHYEEIEEIIDNSILGKTIQRFEFSIFIEYNKIKTFIESFKQQPVKAVG